MKAISARINRGINVGSNIEICDNSGGKSLRVFTIMGLKTTRSRRPAGAIGDLVMGSVVEGKPDIRKQVVLAIIVRQKKEYRRLDGIRIKFYNNAAVIVKDDKGNPRGTQFKGPIAREVVDRWPAIGKLADIIV